MAVAPASMAVGEATPALTTAHPSGSSSWGARLLSRSVPVFVMLTATLNGAPWVTFAGIFEIEIRCPWVRSTGVMALAMRPLTSTVSPEGAVGMWALSVEVVHAASIP